MTKRQAIRRCKWFWKHALKGGVNKQAIFSSLPTLVRLEFLNYLCQCPLCEYVAEKGTCTDTCPLYIQFGHDCDNPNYITSPKEFAEQIMKLKE